MKPYFDFLFGLTVMMSIGALGGFVIGDTLRSTLIGAFIGSLIVIIGTSLDNDQKSKRG